MQDYFLSLARLDVDTITYKQWWQNLTKQQKLIDKTIGKSRGTEIWQVGKKWQNMG